MGKVGKPFITFILLWFHLPIGLYKSTEVAQVGPHHGRKMHKWTLIIRDKHRKRSREHALVRKSYTLNSRMLRCLSPLCPGKQCCQLTVCR